MRSIVNSHVDNVPPLQALRHMRHPNIVKYLSSKSDPGKVYMLTECVVPAKFSLQKLSSVEAVVGIRDIGKALDFMLNRVSGGEC